jgi:hypothetical protein
MRQLPPTQTLEVCTRSDEASYRVRRELKQQISEFVYRTMVADTSGVREDNQERLQLQRDQPRIQTVGSSEKSLPNPTTALQLLKPDCHQATIQCAQPHQRRHTQNPRNPNKYKPLRRSPNPQTYAVVPFLTLPALRTHVKENAPVRCGKSCNWLRENAVKLPAREPVVSPVLECDQPLAGVGGLSLPR